MRRRLTLVLQLALASVAVFAVLWALFGRPGDKVATPIAASGAVAGDSASGTPPPDDSSFEPSSPAPIELLTEDAFDVSWRKPPRAALVFDVENGDSLYRRRATEERPIARPQPADPRRLPRHDRPQDRLHRRRRPLLRRRRPPPRPHLRRRPARLARPRQAGGKAARPGLRERLSYSASSFFLRSVSFDGWTRLGSPGILG